LSWLSWFKKFDDFTLTLMSRTRDDEFIRHDNWSLRLSLSLFNDEGETRNPDFNFQVDQSTSVYFPLLYTQSSIDDLGRERKNAWRRWRESHNVR
jgi:hypothetical protein